MSPIVIDSLQTQPYVASDDVTLIPPGAIKVADKTGADLFALRFNSADLEGVLNGSISSQGTGEYTCGILFQSDADELLNGTLIFSSGKMAVSATGAENVSGIYGGDLAISGIIETPLSGSLKISSKSATTANAAGVYADTEFGSELAMNVDVKADASKGTRAQAVGFSGEATAQALSDKFKLNIQATAGTDNAEAVGFLGGLTMSGQLGGTFTVKADATKGEDAKAYGVEGVTDVSGTSGKFKMDIQAKSGTGYAEACAFYGALTGRGQLDGSINVKADSSKGYDAGAAGVFGATQVAAISDKFKLNVQVNAGLGDATAYAFFRKVEITEGALGGTISLSAATAKDSMGTARATAFYLGVEAASISDKFKLTAQAKFASTESQATGFASTVMITGSIGGTMTVSSNALAKSQATGFTGDLQATTVSDKFKLTVSAKSEVDSAEAQGFAVTNFTNGLSGKVSVSAVSKTGDASALGGSLSSECTFRTATANSFAVSAQSKNSATATGLSGDGDVGLQGILAVQAKGADSTAYGINAGSGVLTGYIGSTGSVAAVGNAATGVSGGDASWFTVNGGLYAGNKGSATGIANSLRKLVGTGKSAAGLNKSADQAISLGSNSTLTVNNGAVVIGDVTLGGTSMMEISTGAQLYGDIDMSGSGTLNIYIGGSLSKAATITLNSDDAGIFTKSSGVTLTVTATELTETGSYVLLAGSNLSGLSDDYDTLFEQLDFESYGLQAEWKLDLSGKTDTLTMILTDMPVGSTSSLLSATDFNSADRMLASSSLTDQLATSGADAWKNALIA